MFENWFQNIIQVELYMKYVGDFWTWICVEN